MGDTNSSRERREREQRRCVDCGPPEGVGERRVNIERRLFDLGLDHSSKVEKRGAQYY